jgi:hypothetical protein
MAKKNRSQTAAPMPAHTLKPIGAPVKLHKEQFLQLKVLSQTAGMAAQQAEQVIALAQQAAAHAQQLAQAAQAAATQYATKTLGLNLDKVARLQFHDDTHTIQRMG